MCHTKLVSVAACLAVALAPTQAGATPINGNLLFFPTTLELSATTLDFFGGAGCAVPGPGVDGCFLAGGPLTGDFATLTPGALAGSISDLQGPLLSGPISSPAFVSVVNGIGFDLTQVAPGVGVDCATVDGSEASVSCTPVISELVSPFVLVNSANGTDASISFVVDVNGYLGSAGTGTSSYTGMFLAPSAGMNIAGILDELASGGSVTAGYSATFASRSTPPVPEPATLMLLGMAVAGSILRRTRSTHR